MGVTSHIASHFDVPCRDQVWQFQTNNTYTEYRAGDLLMPNQITLGTIETTKISGLGLI